MISGFVFLVPLGISCYVPDAPVPRSGTLVVMDANRVEPMPLSFLATLRSIRALGRGVGESIPVSAPGSTSSHDG